MKNVFKKISAVLNKIFGYGIMICLFAGGMTFFAYVVALIVGGDTAVQICDFVSKVFFPAVIKISNILILVGLVSMYLKGEMALTAKVGKNEK